MVSFLIELTCIRQGRYPNMPQFEGYFHTAKMLLSRFHFVCNGSAPLRLEWKNSKATKLANLKPHEIQFMNETQRAIQKRGTSLAIKLDASPSSNSIFIAARVLT